jgi:hypothetical protein
VNETSRSELDLFCKDLCFPGWVMTYRADSYFCRNVPLICVRFVDKSSKKVNSGNSSLQKTTEGLKVRPHRPAINLWDHYQSSSYFYYFFLKYYCYLRENYFLVKSVFRYHYLPLLATTCHYLATTCHYLPLLDIMCCHVFNSHPLSKKTYGN